VNGVVRPQRRFVVISFGDNVRVVETPLTRDLGLAGRRGQVYGETTPSLTNVEVVGGTTGDYAVAVQLEGETDSIWFAPQLLEFIDHAPGTEIVIGKKRLVRDSSGEWIENAPKEAKRATKPWWQFWK
jgi:hypothetical protein